jgi:hypothetical protein
MKVTQRAAAPFAAALVAALAPAVVATTGATAAPAGTPAVAEPAVAAAPHRTVVDLDLDGCDDDCSVTLIQAIDGRRKVWQTRSKRTVDGEVRFSVPWRRTAGMTVTVMPDWHRNNFVPYTAVHYAGMRDGQQVSAAVAARKKRAYACLEGTRRRELELDVQVDRFRAPGVRGNPVPTARVYTEEAMPAVGPRLRTFRGALGGQDVLLCKR